MSYLAPITNVMRQRTLVSRLRPDGRTRFEVWAADTTDGRWHFERLEDPGTPWLVRSLDPAVIARVGEQRVVTSRSTLRRCRVDAANGMLDHEVECLVRNDQAEAAS